jgi:oligopeptidase A
MTIVNPLLIGRGLPPFAEIEPAHIVPAVTKVLAAANDRLTEIEASIQQILESRLDPTWDNLVEPLDKLSEGVSWTWGIVGHLMGVKNSPELRAAYEQMQPEVVKFWMRLGQSSAVYRGFKELRSSNNWRQLAEAQQRIIEAAIRDAELSGVGLAGETKERFNEIQLELAELANKFSNNVLDSTKAYSLTLTQPEEVAGLPPSALSQTAQAARERGYPEATPENGPWVVTLDIPSYLPFLQHAKRRDLREKLYRAYVCRAANGEFDNQPIVRQILACRREMAKILGFADYAALSLASKMAPSVAAVEELIQSLRGSSYDAAKGDLAALQEFAKSHNAPEGEGLQLWDTTFWAERLREAKFDFNDEELRPYFPLEGVLDGLFKLASRLFEIEISAADGSAPIWHPDVRFFQVCDRSGEPIAYFYLDPYSRPAEKRGGAWMDDCVGRAKMPPSEGSGVRLPVAYLICNQTPPVDDRPSLMTFGEVETLFHEFGHGLQHMLTSVDYAGAAGIRNVEWDAVELPSQFMENWCYHRPTLLSLGKHYQTGEALPEHYYQKILAARTFMSGSAMLRQLYFSWLDVELHHRYDPQGSETIEDTRSRIAALTTVIPPLPEDRFLCSFGHIFAGGYAAGYYSYKWAEVLSADAFAAFEEANLDDEASIAATGKRFRDTVLAMGGSKHPLEVFKAFRGREPDSTALLRHNGLVATK